MVDRTNATSPRTTTTAGILRPDELARHADVVRVAPGAALAPYVEYHWRLRWELPPGTTYVSETLPHPACTLSVELGHPRTGVGDDRVVVTGVVTRRFDVTLAGSGWVLGSKFRPGGLAALTGVRARDLTDATVPAARILPAAVVDPLRLLEAGTAPVEAAGAVEAALAPLVPAVPDESYTRLLGLVGRMLADRTLQRVAQLTELHACSVRQLERLFARYVGATPTWVLVRYRVHDVVSALHAGHGGPLADLAAEHGWYDQAHFGRDFAALVGTSPSAYRDQLGRGSASPVDPA